MNLRTSLFAAVVVLGSLGTLGACVRVSPNHADAMSAMAHEPLGEDRLSLHWKFVTSDRTTEVQPQEFATPAVYSDTLFTGSANGWFYALKKETGAVRWRKEIGAVACAPLVLGTVMYVGTGDGSLIAMESQTGKELWRYQSRGPIEQTPTNAGEVIVFANEADQIVAVDAITGKFKWQYKSETPEEYTLRGHAGVTADGDLLYTGFSNGTLAALRKENGSVAWSTSLKGEADRFVDVDATPIVIEDRVYAASSSGGVYAIDKITGLVRWRLPFYDASMPSASGNVGGLASDGKQLYVSLADLGTYALDLGGNVIWRVGSRGGGEPATPLIVGDLLIYSLAKDGMFIANRKTGETLEYFDPGEGISAEPTANDGRLYVMSNRGILYAFDLD